MKKISFLFLFLFLVSGKFLLANEHFVLSTFQDLKKYYYNHQIVHLTLKTLLAQNGNIFIKGSYPIDVNSSKINEITYLSSISFELKDNFPKIYISLMKQGVKLDEVVLNINAEVRQLPHPKNFCGILAKRMKIESPVLGEYDKNSNILYFNVVFDDANVNDFKFGKKIEFKLNEKNGTIEEYSYSSLVPKHKTHFNISYFNLLKERYETIYIDAKMNNEEVSTQIELNPVNKKRTYIINIILISFIILWLIIYFFKRNFIYIILIVSTIALLLFVNRPNPKIVLKEGQKVHILPFKHSTIFLIVKKPTKVEVLNERNGYKQILIDGKVGWVKDDKKN